MTQQRVTNDSGIWRLLGLRLLGGVVVLWAAVTVAFFALKLIPGDPVDTMLGAQSRLDEVARERIREELGLNEHVLVQYGNYLAAVTRGDLGTSFQLDAPVALVISEAAAQTFALTAVAMVFAAAFIALGVVLASWPAGKAFVTFANTVGASTPVFWLGFVLMAVFAFWLGWLPAVSGEGFTGLILPSLTLGLIVAAVTAQLIEASLEDVQSAPFALSSSARGSSPLRFRVRHGVRHALSANLTVIAQIIGGMLGGAVLVEQVFARGGLGTVTLTAITNRDLPVILGVVVFSATVFVVLMFFADVFSRLLDPRLSAKAHRV